MTDHDQKQLGKTLWDIADQLRGAMNADDFRDYMLAFLFLRYLSDNYEKAAQKELGNDYPDPNASGNGGRSSLCLSGTSKTPHDVSDFEQQMRRKVHYVIRPGAPLEPTSPTWPAPRTTSCSNTLEAGFKYIEDQSFQRAFSGLFLGDQSQLREARQGPTSPGTRSSARSSPSSLRASRSSPTDSDALGDAYEYLIDKFAAGSGKKAGEFYTPQRISDILSADRRARRPGAEKPAREQRLASVMDFACGSGSLLLNVRKRMGPNGIGRIYGQEKNITTYNLARMNMLLHGVKDSEFEIHHGDSLTNDWDMAARDEPGEEALTSMPWSPIRRSATAGSPTEALGEDARFKNYGLAPKSAADFSFLLHGFHYLNEDGVMAVILPHGVLFRGGAEAKIRRKLLGDGHIDTVIGLPANLFYSTGIPVCILVLKKCKKTRRRAVHQRVRALREGQAAEPSVRRAHREDRRHLPGAPGERRTVRQARGDGRDRGQRLQPEHLPLCQHGRAGGRDRSGGDARGAGCEIEQTDSGINGAAQRVSQGAWRIPIATT